MQGFRFRVEVIAMAYGMYMLLRVRVRAVDCVRVCILIRCLFVRVCVRCVRVRVCVCVSE